jgi:hypothetical protein
MNPSFENFIENCLNEKLQRKRLKVILARQEQQEESNKSLRAGGLPSSYSMCQDEKIRALNNLISLIK